MDTLLVLPLGLMTIRSVILLAVIIFLAPVTEHRTHIDPGDIEVLCLISPVVTSVASQFPAVATALVTSSGMIKSSNLLNLRSAFFIGQATFTSFLFSNTFLSFSARASALAALSFSATSRITPPVIARRYLTFTIPISCIFTLQASFIISPGVSLPPGAVASVTAVLLDGLGGRELSCFLVFGAGAGVKVAIFLT